MYFCLWRSIVPFCVDNYSGFCFVGVFCVGSAASFLLIYTLGFSYSYLICGILFSFSSFLGWGAGSAGMIYSGDMV